MCDISDDYVTPTRYALVNQGVRVVSFEFDGSGDEGSINALWLPLDFPHLSLEEYRQRIDVGYSPGFDYEKSYTASSAVTQAQTIIDDDPKTREVLEHMAYEALEHFDGDWVNNGGGYGSVYIDLLTGAFHIEGYTRHTYSEHVPSSGTTWDPIDPVTPGKAPELDLVKHIAAQLNQ